MAKTTEKLTNLTVTHATKRPGLYTDGDGLYLRVTKGGASWVCQATGLGRTKLYELIGHGHLDTTTVGRRRLVLVSSLRALIAPET